MAQLLFARGGEEEVSPQDGLTFTPQELRNHIGGDPREIILTPSLRIYWPEDCAGVSRSGNVAATRLLWEYRHDLHHVILYGDAIVVKDDNSVQNE